MTAKLEYESVRCPICCCGGSRLFARGAELKSFGWYRGYEGFGRMNYEMCKECRTVFVNPRIRYCDSTFDDFFPKRIKERTAEDIEKSATLKRAMLQPAIDLLDNKPGRLLEIGCGLGDMLKAAEEFGFTASGTEIDQRILEHCRRDGLDVTHGSVEGFGTHGLPYDIVVMDNVLEHVKDPLRFVEDAHRALKPGGILLVETWAIHRPRTVEEAFGEKWREDLNLDVLAHLAIFRMERLVGSVLERGFALERLVKVFQVETGFMNNLMGRNTRFYDLYFRKAGSGGSPQIKS